MPEAAEVITPEPTAPIVPKASDTPKDSPKDAPAPKTDDWRADLPDDLKKTAERFTSKADAVRAIVNLQKREGQVRVPGKDATDEEKAAYRKAIGIPDKPDDYEFQEAKDLTDEIKASRQKWGKRFHELSVPKGTAKALMGMVHEDMENDLIAQIEADKAFAKAQKDALRNEWKGDFEKNHNLANRAISEIANRAGLKLDDLTKIETKDGRFLLDRAEIAKLFAIIGREMDEGTLGPSLTESERETLDDQIRDIRKQITEAQAEGDSRRANRLYHKEQGLIAKKGNKPIVGSQGRAA